MTPRVVVPRDCPRFNATLPEDVNASGDVTVLDALVVINDIAREGARILQADELLTTFIDVTNDGRVSSLDALRVLNRLSLISGGGEGEAASFAPALEPEANDRRAAGSGLYFQAFPSCFVAKVHRQPIGGVLNYEDSYRGSESIGRKNADTPLYGPLQQVGSVNEIMVFPLSTVEMPVEADSGQVEVGHPDKHLGPTIAPQLPE